MALDTESRQIIYQGATVPQLAAMFEMKSGEVLRKLASVAPVGQKDGKDIYRVREAASYLAKLPDNVVAQVMRLNHMDLPPMLRKEFWTGQNARLKFERDQGDLWDTAAVIEYVSEAFKSVRMSLMLLSDTIERDTVITDDQRERLRVMVDSTMEDIRGRLVEKFRERLTDDLGRPGGGRSVEPAADDSGWPVDTEGL